MTRDLPCVALVGAGPGDPELLTLRAVTLLKQAETVVLDRLVSPDILKLIPPGANCIYAGKAPGKHFFSQSEINDVLVNLARQGRRVVRLKGGDPFIFGRGGEEALHLARHDICFEVVPGVSAASGCAAAFGVPLINGQEAGRVRFVTGHCRDNGELRLNWQSLADPACTLVIYMGLGTIAEVSENLIDAGLAGTTPALAVEKGTTGDERAVLSTLAKLPEDVLRFEMQPPTLFLIGKAVANARGRTLEF